jgi:hypothetical protein
LHNSFKRHKTSVNNGKSYQVYALPFSIFLLLFLSVCIKESFPFNSMLQVKRAIKYLWSELGGEEICDPFLLQFRRHNYLSQFNAFIHFSSDLTLRGALHALKFFSTFLIEKTQKKNEIK